MVSLFCCGGGVRGGEGRKLKRERREEKERVKKREKEKINKILSQPHCLF